MSFGFALSSRSSRVWARWTSDETLVGVVPGIHATGFVKIVHQDHSQQVIDRKSVIGVLLDNLLEVLRGAVVVHVVEVIEGSFGLGIVGRAVSRRVVGG